MFQRLVIEQLIQGFINDSCLKSFRPSCQIVTEFFSPKKVSSTRSDNVLFLGKKDPLSCRKPWPDSTKQFQLVIKLLIAETCSNGYFQRESNSEAVDKVFLVTQQCFLKFYD